MVVYNEQMEEERVDLIILCLCLQLTLFGEVMTEKRPALGFGGE